MIHIWKPPSKYVGVVDMERCRWAIPCASGYGFCQCSRKAAAPREFEGDGTIGLCNQHAKIYDQLKERAESRAKALTTTPETPEQRWASAMLRDYEGCGMMSNPDPDDDIGLAAIARTKEIVAELAAVKRLADRAAKLERENEELRAAKGQR